MRDATWSTPSPATTRSTIASAWSAGRVATSASAAWVESPSTAAAAGSSGAACFDQAGRRQVFDRPPSRPPAPVEHLVAGDGEHPGPERRFVAPEAVDATHHRQPGLGRQVLGGGGRGHREVPQQPGLEVVPEPPERLLVTAGGGDKHGRELGANHRHPPEGPVPEANKLHVAPHSCQTRGPPPIPRVEVRASRVIPAPDPIPMATRRRRRPSREPERARLAEGTIGRRLRLQPGAPGRLGLYPPGMDVLARRCRVRALDQLAGWMTQRGRRFLIVVALS